MLFQDASGLDLNAARLIALIDHLCGQPAETEWLEFKHNNGDGKVIGRCIAALANAARLADRDRAYMMWGVADGTHAVVGTTFQPSSARMENQLLASGWLSDGPAKARHLGSAAWPRCVRIAYESLPWSK
jgi:ATP-dependent DNA helicase RecG